MSENQPSRPGGPGDGRTRPARPSTATYWRRRFFVLATIIGVLTVLIWAVNGMLSVPAAPSQAASSSHASTASSAPLRLSNVLPTPSPTPTPTPTPTRHSGKKRHASKQPPAAAGGSGACAPGSMTLRVSSPQYWYQSGVTPRFTVRAVSRAGHSCRFNMGTRFVAVVITTAQRHIWSSADCASGKASDVVVLDGGKPAVRHTSWNRKTSSPGCGGHSHLVLPGEYQVTAVAGQLHSKTMNFVLGAKGATGP
jgi:hypothetical protein